MSELLKVHPQTPQARAIRRAAEALHAGKLIAYPTDSCYALGCHLGDKSAMEKIRRIRGFDERHHLTLVCRDLSQISQYAQVDNRAFRLLKSATPGSFTFILKASKDVPRRLQHPRRATIGLRVPAHPVVQALLRELGEPILSCTLSLPGDEAPVDDLEEAAERLRHDVDVMLDAGPCGVEPTTVIDLTGEVPVLIRKGRGDPSSFGIAAALG